MFYNAAEKTVTIDDTDMDYVVFGRGQTPFVILPGLSDGLKTVKGLALTLAIYYREFAKDFRVYLFSRKNQLPKGYTTQDMARDQNTALKAIGVESAYVMGVSQGGMIAQHLAIDYPERVKKLVIGVSVSRQNPTLQRVIKGWMEMAEANDYKAIAIDTIEKNYTEKKLKSYRFFYPIISRIGKPKSLERFMIQAEACLNHNAYERLDKIECPTLVIGGDNDNVVGKNSSEEMAAKIPNSKLIIYEGLGHSAYEEAKDFNQQVKRFLLAQ